MDLPLLVLITATKSQKDQWIYHFFSADQLNKIA